MNRLIAAVIVIVASISSPAASAEAGEPEYINVIAARDPATMEWVALERATTTIETRVRGLGLGGGESRGVIQGEKSPVRFKAGQAMEFVVRVERQDKDPLTLIQFFRLDSAGGRRSLQLANIRNPFTMRNNSDALRSHTIAFTAAKMGTNFFVFVPTEPLGPGEYVTGVVGVEVGFNFGVDQ